jgi:hypothetical protein
MLSKKNEGLNGGEGEVWSTPPVSANDAIEWRRGEGEVQSGEAEHLFPFLVVLCTAEQCFAFVESRLHP